MKQMKKAKPVKKKLEKIHEEVLEGEDEDEGDTFDEEEDFVEQDEEIIIEEKPVKKPNVTIEIEDD